MTKGKTERAAMAEAVKVIVRCRPMNKRELDLKCNLSVGMDSRIGQCSIKSPHDKKAPPKTFTFDGAYFVDSTTEQIYADIGFGLVEGVTEGFNGTIFAYGQTGCGKSFSMQGIKDPPTQKGIIPRAFDHIFETIQVSENTRYLVHASYLEIYNEEIRDLLGKDAKKKLDLKEHPDKGVYVQGLLKTPCKSVKDCEHIMQRGWDNRATGATLMNAESSRSHSIFTIYLERCEPDESGEEHIRAAKLNLVDLAGSERQGKTGATGDRLKEATKINLSLSALGNVISALVDGKSKHIPYRDSKLTRMLQDSLGGNTKTLMVACLSPADNNYDETLSTLRYANRAKNIKNKPKINEDPKDAMLREYQDEINKLKAMLRGEIPIDSIHLDGSGQAVQPKVVEKVVKDPEAEARVEEYQKKMAMLQSDFENMRINNERLQDEMEKLQNQYDIESAEDSVLSPGQQGSDTDAWATQDPSLASWDEEGMPPEYQVIPRQPMVDRSTSMEGIPIKRIPILVNAGTNVSQNGEMEVVTEPITAVQREPLKKTQKDLIERQDSPDQPGLLLLSDDEVGAAAFQEEDVIGIDDLDARAAKKKKKKRPPPPPKLEDEDDVDEESAPIEDSPRSKKKAKKAKKSRKDEQPPSRIRRSSISVPDAKSIHDWEQQAKLAVPADGLEIASMASGMEEDDSHYTKQKAGQKAIHLATSQAAGGKDMPTDPKMVAEHEAVQEALRRLQELQQQMVGGEQATNEEVKKRHEKKLKHVEERKKKLQEALAHMDGEDIMLGIFENTTDEIAYKERMLEKEKERAESLQREILDLQSEFEFDRIDYLDSIRKQDQQIKWLESVVERIHPCLRRDCNYVNLDRVKALSQWNEEEQQWVLPRIAVERSQLPGVGNEQRAQPVYDGAEHDLRFEDRYLQKLQGRQHNTEYFKSNRQDTMLDKVNKDKNRTIVSDKRGPSPKTNGNMAAYMNKQNPRGGQPGSSGMSAPGSANEPGPSPRRRLTAAEVHGQLQQFNETDQKVRKPMRLESLNTSADKKKRKDGTYMDHFD